MAKAGSRCSSCSRREGTWSELVAETLLEILTGDTSAAPVPVGQQAKTFTRLRRFCPPRMYEKGVRRTFSLDKTQ